MAVEEHVGMADHAALKLRWDDPEGRDNAIALLYDAIRKLRTPNYYGLPGGTKDESARRPS